MWPGVSGVHATLTPGVEVLVQFIDGNRAKPAIVGFVGKGGAGFAPVGVDIGSSPTSYLTLDTPLQSQLSALKTAISGAGTTPGDGGAAFKTALLAALSAWPGTTASTLVRSK